MTHDKVKNYWIATCMALIAFAFSAHSAGAGEDQLVSLGEDIAQKVYYNLENGIVATESNNAWDLAFDVSPMGANIRVNGQAGTLLYEYPHGDTSHWEEMDTTGISGWPALYNDDASWSRGAFAQNADTSDPADMGWGQYSMITHEIEGTKLYFIALANDVWKKLWIEKLADGTYHFLYANIDGSDEVEATLTKSGFEGKSFGYYSLRTHEILDTEPLSTDWDLVFTAYMSEVGPAVHYRVTGVLQNAGVTAAEARGLENPEEYTHYQQHPFQEEINTIGHDWKSFDMETFSYIIEDSLCYFVKDRSGKVWKLLFTDFEGSSTGNIHFTQSAMDMSSIKETDKPAPFTVYPNPATDFITIHPHAGQEPVHFRIYNMTGSRVMEKKLSFGGDGQAEVSTEGLEPGLYHLTITSGKSISSEKLIIQ